MRFRIVMLRAEIYPAHLQGMSMNEERIPTKTETVRPPVYRMKTKRRGDMAISSTMGQVKFSKS